MNYQSLLGQPDVFRQCFEKHPDGICILDLDGHILDANASALRMFGYTKRELVEASWRQRAEPSSSNCIRSDDSHEAKSELEILHKQGHIVYVSCTWIPLVSDRQKLGWFIVLQDITQNRERHKEYLDVQEMFSFISSKSENIITSFSGDGVFTYVSPTVEALLGYTPDEVVGKPAGLFNHPETNAELLKFRTSLPSDQNTERFTGRLRHKNGEYRWYETTVQYIRDESGAVKQAIGVGRDITDRKEAEETIAHMAYHDPLTDLPNRRLFKQRVNWFFTKSKHLVHGLVLLDLDGFKYVNDTFGHDIGDVLLTEVAARLTRVVDDADIVARLGGDEFTIFRTNVTNRDGWARFIEHIETVISEPVIVEGHALNVTASVGTALYPADGDSIETLLRQADAEMYYAKSKTRGQL